jgi:protein ImuB
MRRGEAEAVCPTVITVVGDPAIEAVRFEPVAQAIEELIPAIELAAPGLVFAPVAGAVKYYGGEAALVKLVAKEIDHVTGPGFKIGLAAGPFAAQRAAELAAPVYIVEDDAAFLASLDVAALGSEELAATFRWLGITTLGALAELPRDALTTRFGPLGTQAHRLAHGLDRVPQNRVIPPDLDVEERFSPPLENLDQAAFIARAMAHRLVAGLRSHGAAPHRVEVTAEAADGSTRVRTWRNRDPFDEASLAERVRWQLNAWLDSARFRSGPGIRGGVVRLHIAPADVSDRGRQLALTQDARSVAEAERAFIQTQAIVGLDGVVQARPKGGRTPGDRVAWYRWGEPPPEVADHAPWPGRIPDPTPTLVPPETPILEVEWDGGMPTRLRLGSRWVEVVSWAGPWRDIGRWWEGSGPCDRYQLVTSAGAFLCEVRDGKTYLAGVYD